MKLKTKEVKEYRIAQLAHQDYKCALCDEQLAEEEAVLDHDHKSGLVRKVLHRGCNSLLGKIENSLPRSRVDIRRLKGIAHNLIGYLTKQHTQVVHPTHRTVEERKQRAKVKARQRRIKAKGE